ncbi:unnamed protein product [Prunus armeniaca]|uniref:Uncharacterized protein n=1 Tax=Prunus armeniaca TaxID=36596 RepID=A0A6J5X1L1_PRUAR|nr:unnamed protein product [Prunus armeniaca]CAB4306177.1 unnamed protein product [Prunus armeniaca]
MWERGRRGKERMVWWVYSEIERYKRGRSQERTFVISLCRGVLVRQKPKKRKSPPHKGSGFGY